MLKGKTILLGVTGSIAAYKAAELASALVKQHACVHVIMTKNAQNFIHPLTFETLTGNKCLTDTFDPAPTNLTVSRNGVTLLPTDYTYADGLLTLPPDGTAGDTVPAATYQRDPSGALVVTPGVVEYVITGTI